MPVMADPGAGFFSVDKERLEPVDFLLVYEQDKGRIRVHLSDVELNESARKFMAGNPGNVKTLDCVDLYIPVKVDSKGTVSTKGEAAEAYSHGIVAGRWKIPAEQIRVRGSLKKLEVQVQGSTRSPGSKIRF